MKTIRSSTFETNSSSTHAYSLHTSAAEPDMKPIIKEWPVKIQLHTSDPSGWISKVGFLLKYAKEISDVKAFNRIVETVENFAECKISPWESTWHSSSKKYVSSDVTADSFTKPRLSDSEIENIIGDQWYSFNNEDYSNDFKAVIEGNISTPEKIVGYVFNSSRSYDEHEYYDG